MKRPNRTVSPGGTITFSVLDVRGQVVEIYVGTDDAGATPTDPTGGGWDPNNNMVLVTANQFDHGQDGGDGNLTQVTDHVDGSITRVTSYEFDFRNRQTVTDGELDYYATVEYDNLNRIVKRERYDTDAEGNLISKQETKFDNRGEIYQEIQWAVDPTTGTVGDALTDNMWFDPTLNVIKTKPSGLMTRIEFEYDSLSRLVKETNPLDAETTFAYDDASNRISLTDAEENTTTWGYNGIGDIVKVTNALDESRTFEYDDAGMLSVRTDRNGRVIEFGYDDAGNLIEERWKEGETTVNTRQFTWDADSRLSAAADEFSSYAYGYDVIGAMNAADNNGTPGVPRVVLSADYNRQRERTSVSAAVASTNDFLNGYQYDALGRTSRIQQQSNGGNTVAPKRVGFSYEVRGGYSRIHRFADLSATNLVAQTTYEYDDFGRIKTIDHTKGQTSLASHEYSFNATRLIDQHKTVDGDSDYDYDNAAQLLEALHSFEADEEYSYDLTGNRTNTGYSTGPNNQLLSDGTYTYEYDPEGNRVKRTTTATDETVEYQRDHRNRLTKVTFKDDEGEKTREIQYVYDMHDRRIAKLFDETGNGTVDEEWHLVYDGIINTDLANIVLTFDANGDLRHRYLHGPHVDQILADEEASGDILWQLTDHLGTVRDLAEYDDQQDETSIVNRLTYNAYGQITSQSNASKTPLYSFTGREWDADAVLFYYRARWYDALVGRFASEDPIGFDGGDPNTFRYVHNSPAILTDPTGRDLTGYGLHCGPRNSDLRGIDTLDEGCRAHDRCVTWRCVITPCCVLRCDAILCGVAWAVDCNLEHPPGPQRTSCWRWRRIIIGIMCNPGIGTTPLTFPLF